MTMHSSPSKFTPPFRASTLLLGAALLCFGYYGLFFGESFFVEDDPMWIFDYASGNAAGNGWRPDLGLGISMFLGDPGIHHPWSIFSLLQRLSPTSTLLYSTCILSLLLTAIFSVACLVRKAVPNLPTFIPTILGTLVAFGPLQHEFFFQRHWILLTIGTCWIIIILHNHFTTADKNTFIYLSLLFFFTFFLGSYPSLLETVCTGFIYTVLFMIINRMPASKVLILYFTTNLLAGVCLLLLGMWIFYSIAIEALTVPYVRDSIYQSTTLTTLPLLDISFKSLTSTLFSYFHSGLLPKDMILQRFFSGGISWENVTPVFPIIFVCILCERSRFSWVTIIKWMVVVLYVHQILFTLSPLYRGALFSVFNGYPLAKFQPVTHALQAVLLAAFIASLYFAKKTTTQYQPPRPAKIVACLLLFLYTIMLAGILGTHFAGAASVKDAGRTLWNHLPLTLPASLNYEQFHRLALAAMNNIQSSTTISLLALYTLSAGMALAFISPRLGKPLFRHPAAFVMLLLLSNLALSWAIYPLGEPLENWSTLSQEAPFVAGDRFTYFNSNFQIDRTQTTDSDGVLQEWEAYLSTYKDNSTDRSFPPGLNLTGVKGFTQKNVDEYMKKAFPFNDHAPTSFRDIRNKFSTDRRMAVAAVKYYYTVEPSRNRTDYQPPRGLTPYARNGKLFVYENKKAFPYYYLAKNILSDKNGDPLATLDNGSVVIEEDLPAIGAPGKSLIHLDQFSNGKLRFKGTLENAGLLVVSDAWHPFWKASIDGQNTRILKANGIFKAIEVPQGDHVIEFVFDTSPYRLGIYISIAAWVSLLMLWWYLRKKQATAVNSENSPTA
ncbi:MAG: YfhO family protein [Pseudodesulfovibrio sp.]